MSLIFGCLLTNCIILLDEYLDHETEAVASTYYYCHFEATYNYTYTTATHAHFKTGNRQTQLLEALNVNILVNCVQTVMLCGFAH